MTTALSSVGTMVTGAMITWASIASMAWIAIYPWAKLKRLSELEAIEQADESMQGEKRSQTIGEERGST